MTVVDPMAAIRQTFFQECEEGLADLESGLMQMEAGGADHEMVNAVFRAVHSIKGGAGAFGLDGLVRFAHVFETTMDEIRSDRLVASPDVVAVLLRANDVLADLVAAARDGGEMDEAHVAAVVAELKAASGAPDEEAEDDGMGDFVFTPVAFAAAPEAGDEAEFDIAALLAQAGAAAPEAASTEASGGFTIRYTPTAALYAKANETTLLLRELASLGAVTVEMDDARLPLLDDLDPEEAYLGWTITLRTDAPEAAVREVFEFVEDDCTLEITALGAEPQAEAAFEPVTTLDPPLVAAGEADIIALLAMARAASDPDLVAREAAAEVEALAAQPLAPVIPLPTAATPSLVATQAPVAAPPAAATASIRVDLDRVDRLIDLVGELVINQAMLSQRVTEAGLSRSSAAGMALDELEHLTRDIQDSVMAIRAQPVKSVFQRMPRLVREVAAMTGKQVRLVTEGENTEVDKTVIERLSDPLTHMIRNAIDHGLEPTEKRLAAGKPAEGVVKLSALHRSGRIVLEVSDDGGGINRPRVRQIAIDKGLIDADAPLTDEETDNLIFLPGFSTAEVVSDVSGRGVGMDVVRRSIQALGGRITIASRPGQGSTFTMSLPLTLAVLDGMVVSIAEQTLVAPLTAIVETLQPKPSQIHAMGDGCVISIRDAYLPLIDVGAALGYRTCGPAPTDCVVLLVETESGGRAALMVDDIQGQRQVVIKSLEANFQHVKGVAAATILGDGRVALILDVDAVVAQGTISAGAPAEAPLMLAAG